MRELCEYEIDTVCGGESKVIPEIVVPGKIPDDAGQLVRYTSSGSAPAAGISEAGFLQRFFLGLPEGHPSLIADKVDLETGMGFSSGLSTNLRASYNCSSCHDRRLEPSWSRGQRGIRRASWL